MDIFKMNKKTEHIQELNPGKKYYYRICSKVIEIFENNKMEIQNIYERYNNKEFSASFDSINIYELCQHSTRDVRLPDWI